MVPAPQELNSPAVGSSSRLPDPILGSPIVQGGPVSNSLSRIRPLLSRMYDGSSARLYLRSDYLLWDVSGMEPPPLVTTGPLEKGTGVFFGGSEVNGGSASGFLTGGGFWITDDRSVAIEAEYFQLGDPNDGFVGSGQGDPILARPYFDTSMGIQSARLISYPNQYSGNIRIGADSDLRSLMVNARISLCPTHGACCVQCRNA